MKQNNILHKKNLINCSTILFFSIIFGIVYAIANELSLNQQIGISASKIFVGSIIFFVAESIVYFVPMLCPRDDNGTISHRSRTRVLLFFILLLGFYLLCFLTYFPGVTPGDALNILKYGLSTIIQHPAAYVVIVTFFKKIGELLGSAQWGVAFYSLFQLVVVCFLEAMLLEWLWIKTNYKIIRYGTLLYFLAEPIFPLFAISMLKDTVWSLFVVCLVAYVWELTFNNEQHKSKWFWLGFLLTLCSVVLLRNNGVYIVMPLVLVMGVCLKYVRKELFRILMAMIVLLALKQLPFIISGRHELFQERAGIPLQQICAVVASEEGVMTAEQEEFISQIMPLDEIRSEYNVSSVDPIKWASTFDRGFLDQNFGEFLKVWAGMLPMNLKIYIKAYLQQTFCYWAPRNDRVIQCFFSAFREENGIHDQPLWMVSLSNIMRKYYTKASYFINEGVLFWIMMGSLLVMLMRYRRREVFLVYLPLILLWLTIMISTPVSSGIRYVLAFVYAIPVLALFVFMHPERDSFTP